MSIRAGVSEASAIVGLIATAVQLSKAIVGVAGKSKDARNRSSRSDAKSLSQAASWTKYTAS